MAMTKVACESYLTLILTCNFKFKNTLDINIAELCDKPRNRLTPHYQV